MNTSATQRDCEPNSVRNLARLGVGVIAKSGEFTVRETDFWFPGRRLSVHMQRVYRSSLSKRRGSFGLGWSSSFDKRIEFTQSGVLYHNGEGRRHSFGYESSSKYLRSPRGVYAVLEQGASQTFLLRQRRGTVLHFQDPQSGGRLASIEHVSGNKITFHYHERGFLLVDTSNRPFWFGVDDGLISSIADPDGPVAQYHYTGDKLISVILPRAQMAVARRLVLSYNKRELLEVYARGSSSIHNEYDDDDKVSRQTYRGIDYSLEYRLGSTVLSDGDGNHSRITYDEAGRATRSELRLLPALQRLKIPYPNTAAEQLTVDRQYNEHGETVRREFAGEVAEWKYDEQNTDPRARGNCMAYSRKQGDSNEVRRVFVSYEPTFQRMTQVKYPSGSIRSNRYDDAGNLIATTVHRPKTSGDRGRSQMSSDVTLMYDSTRRLSAIINQQTAATTLVAYADAGSPISVPGTPVRTNEMIVNVNVGGQAPIVIQVPPGHPGTVTINVTPPAAADDGTQDRETGVTNMLQGGGLALTAVGVVLTTGGAGALVLGGLMGLGGGGLIGFGGAQYERGVNKRDRIDGGGIDGAGIDGGGIDGGGIDGGGIKGGGVKGGGGPGIVIVDAGASGTSPSPEPSTPIGDDYDVDEFNKDSGPTTEATEPVDDEGSTSGPTFPDPDDGGGTTTVSEGSDEGTATTGADVFYNADGTVRVEDRSDTTTVMEVGPISYDGGSSGGNESSTSDGTEDSSGGGSSEEYSPPDGEAPASRGQVIDTLNAWYQEKLLSDVIYGGQREQDEQDPRFKVAQQVREWIKQGGTPITFTAPDQVLGSNPVGDLIRQLNQMAESSGLYFGSATGLDDHFYYKDKRGWGMSGSRL